MGIHLAGVVGSVACIPAIAAWTLRKSLPLPAAIVLWHVAGTGFAVSLAATSALARHTTWLLGKHKDGTISGLNRVIFWPYFAGLQAKLAIQRRYSTEPAWNRITDTYYLGAWPSEESLVPAVHPSVLDVTCELPLQVRPPAYKMIPVWDTHAPSPEQIDIGVAWAQQQERAGRKVLIHCAHGHGRSATMLCAIVIANGQAKTIAEAEAMLKKERPRVRLNNRQRESLTNWYLTTQKGN